MPDNRGVYDFSASPLCDISASTVSLVHLAVDKTGDLRAFLNKHQVSNAAAFGRIEGEVATFGSGAALDEKHKAIEAHRDFGKLIKEEQRELTRQAEFIERALAKYVAHCQAAKLRIELKAAELGVDISIDIDAEGDLPMGNDAAGAARENESSSSKYAEKGQEMHTEAAVDTSMLGDEVQGDDVEKQDEAKTKASKPRKKKKSKKKKSQDDMSQEKARDLKTLLTEAERSRIKAALAKLEPLENAARIIETGEEQRLDGNGAPQRPRSTRRAALEAQIKMKKEILEFGAKGRPDSARNDIEDTSTSGSDQAQMPSQELVSESKAVEDSMPGMEELITISEAPEQLSTLMDRVPLKRKRADEAVEERPAKMVLAFRPRPE